MSAQVRAIRTNLDGNGVELASSGFSPLSQRPESARTKRRLLGCQFGEVARLHVEFLAAD
jgi:hypothetical protein